MIRHPTQSLFLGTFPMGCATIVNMEVFVCVPSWGPWAITLAWSMWWIDAIVSIAVCFYLTFVMSVFLSGSQSFFPYSLYDQPQKLISYQPSSSQPQGVSLPKCFRIANMPFGQLRSTTFYGVLVCHSPWLRL